MFFKNLKNKLICFFFLLTIIPYQVLAYSDYIISGGENVGISINSKNVIIVGTYQVNDIYPAKKANLKVGDRIISINGENVNSIEDMINIIENSSSQDALSISYMRGSNTLSTILKLEKDENNILKSGLYVKDSVSGIGTLTFIDPNTKLYGALGHEILEKTTGQRIEIKDGKIYNSVVTGIKRSNNGTPGEKNARYNSDVVYGNIKENTINGVFGTYTDTIPNKKLYKVAKQEDIVIGDAKIKTVVRNDDVEEFSIKILKISPAEQETKNLLFEIIDKELIDVAGGIVQGMSGSPIIQGEYIIGAVTHVVVDDPTKGYGIFITNMLEEAEN